MDDFFRVSGLERVRDLLEDRQDLSERHRSRVETFGQRVTPNELEDEKETIVAALDSEDGPDIRMVHRGENTRLALEPRDSLRITRHFFGQGFDGDFTLELRVAGKVDLAHTPRTKRRKNFENAKSCLGCQTHRFCLVASAAKSVAPHRVESNGKVQDTLLVLFQPPVNGVKFLEAGEVGACWRQGDVEVSPSVTEDQAYSIAERCTGLRWPRLTTRLRSGPKKASIAGPPASGNPTADPGRPTMPHMRSLDRDAHRTRTALSR